MQLEEIKDSVKDWFNDRLKNPYFASVLAVWLITNRVVVFGLFNFHENQSLQDRVSWVHYQLQNKAVGPFNGFDGIILYSFLIGLVAMISFNYINVFGKIVYNILGRGAIWLLRWTEPSKWIPIKEVTDLKSKNDILEKELDQKKGELSSLKDEKEKTLNKISMLNESNILLVQGNKDLTEKAKPFESLKKEHEKLKLELKDRSLDILTNSDKNNINFSINRLELDEFFRTPKRSYLEGIIKPILDNKSIGLHVPIDMIQAYISEGLIATKDESYIVTKKGKTFYDEYLKVKP